MDHSLLLLEDMADLWSIRQYVVFLNLKSDLAMVSLFFFFNCTFLPFQAFQATFRVEEMVNYSHRKMKEEEGRWIAAVDAFHMAEKVFKSSKAS